MEIQTVLADPRAVRLKLICPSEGVITLVVEIRQTTSHCPRCQQATRKIHIRYTRTVADLPWQGVAVRLQLLTRRFFCNNALCVQRIFCARLPTVVARYARRTARLEEALAVISFALGGAAGMRAARHLQLHASASTLLRRIRRTPPVEHPTPRVLGVDDWAKRKGQTYGTILVDLERRRVVDLLPDRESGTLADWLTAHPGVEIISRDRASAYADGARDGAPHAIQVADRWHLLKNLGDALERFFTRRQSVIRRACERLHAEERANLSEQVVALLPTRGESTQVCVVAQKRSDGVTAVTQRRLATRERRLMRYLEAVRLYRAGLSHRRIARQLGINVKTVGRFLRAGEFPELSSGSHYKSKLDPFAAYLKRRWSEEGCFNATRLWREVRSQGFTGGVDVVRRFIARLKLHLPEEARRKLKNRTSGPAARPVNVRPPLPSPRQVSLLCTTPPPKLEGRQRQLLNHILGQGAEVEAVYILGQSLARMLRARRAGQRLSPWLNAASRSGVCELRRFASGLWRDYRAVEAAMTSPWSNGQVEGQVNRLKLIKRRMYGRANFDLLRLRVLHSG
jgi:transposase